MKEIDQQINQLEITHPEIPAELINILWNLKYEIQSLQEQMTRIKPEAKYTEY